MKSSMRFTAVVLALFASMGLFPQSVFAGKVVQPQPVTIVNPAVVTESAPQQPFQWEGGMDFADNAFSTDAYAEFTVPAGKRLVVEYVTGKMWTSPGDPQDFMITTMVNGAAVRHYVTLSPEPPGCVGCWKAYIASQGIRVYADPGTIVELRATRSSPGTGNMRASVSGYLLDVQ